MYRVCIGCAQETGTGVDGRWEIPPFLIATHTDIIGGSASVETRFILPELAFLGLGKETLSWGTLESCTCVKSSEVDEDSVDWTTGD